MWIKDADKNGLVVGTQARIFYQDAMSRTRVALKFNEMVRNGEIGPVMLEEITMMYQELTHHLERHQI